MSKKYFIGDSVIYGNLVIKPSLLTEHSEQDFYKHIAKSLKQNNLLEYKEAANSLYNLKRGVTIGKDYFIIE